MRQYLLATTPGGRTTRWGEDEPGADQIFEDLSSSDSVPGGCKELNCALARKQGVDYGDMQGGTKIEEFGAGQFKVWEGTLQDALRTAGDKLVMDPAAVGYRSNLTDDESAQCIPIDADLSGWGDPSARRTNSWKAAKINLNAQVKLLPAGTPNEEEPKSFLNTPAIDHSWTQINNGAGAEPDVAESWFDSNGIELGRVILDFLNIVGLGLGDVNWGNILWASTDDNATSVEQLKDFNATSSQHQDFSIGAAHYFLLLQDFYGPAFGPVEGKWEVQWQNIKVQDRSGIPIAGTWPNVGVLASDVITYALARWAPLLNFTTGPTGTVRPSTFPIPHLPFKEPTTVEDMVAKANRFELNEWAVWPGQLGPTFYMNPRGEREGRKRWRGRVGPTQLRETGQSMKRVFNGVLVQYQDTDGSTRILAPTGSGYPLTSERCLDLDPLNPANQIPGLRKWTKIAMKRVSTEGGAEETAERFLEQTKLLDNSGEATLTGYVEDEHGAMWPYYCVKSGDLFDPIDAANPGYRYIISTNRNRAARSSTIALDAPPDSYEALLERLDVEEMGIG
jgi:hypothetical protein